MNEKDFEEYLEKEVVVAHDNNKISHMALSAIFRKYYSKFESIRLSYKDNLDNRDENFNCYSKKIKDILIRAGKFQKSGEPISEFHIKTQMNREKARRKSKGLTESPTPTIDNETSFKAPTTDFHSSGVVKVSPKNNKKVVAPTSGIVEPTKIENMAKATHILEQEIKIYKKDGVMPVWSSNDEWSLIDFKRQAGIEKVNVSQLAIKGVLTPRYNQDIIDYFEAWLNKAYVCEKLFKD